MKDLSAAVSHVAVLVAPADGVLVLRETFRSLQGDFPGAIVILLHPGTGRERGVADNLNVASNFMVLPGLDGTVLRNGHAYVVPAGSNLAIDADGSLVRAGAISDAASEAMLASLVRYGSGAIAVALTALDPTESEGFRQVRAAGGHTIALDEADRLWADSSGARVVPDPEDELLTTTALGPRMIALAVPTVLPA